MKDISDYPKVSVVIPVRRGGSVKVVQDSLKRVDYPQELIETFVMEGDNPSRQRNNGIKRSTGEIIFFFDDDSSIDPNLFKETMVTYGKYPEASGIGGPSCLVGDTWVERSTMAILTSFLGVYKIQARYKPVGGIRYTNEDELISCNLSIRRKIFENEIGFNESLYPNEENELINRLIKNGHRFVYNPRCLVIRTTDASIRQFLRRIFSYGRGRAEQLFVEPSVTSFLRLLPVLLLVYLLMLFFIHQKYLMVPFYFYILTVLTVSFYNVRSKFKLMPLVFILYILTHVSYALGECYGITKLLRNAKIH